MRCWVLGVVLLGLGTLARVDAEVVDPNAAVRTALQGELEDFSVPGWDRRPELWPQPHGGPFVPEVGPALQDYRKHLVQVAQWTGGPVWHQVGTLPLVRGGQTVGKLAVNVFFPPGRPRGTLLFVHGYLSHAANFAYTFGWFVARGWAVVTLDLPGHGLSTGPRGDVETFSDYGDAVQAWLAWQRSQGWDGPRVLVAHSLGTAAVLEALERPGVVVPDRVVFCAPLLRTRWFPVVSLMAAVTSPWMDHAPPRLGWDGYLDGYQIPTHWLRALDAWLGTLDRRTPVRLPLWVFSGDQDTIVDSDWNLAEYRRLVPGVQELVLPGWGHLFLSDLDTRQRFQALLDQVVAPVSFSGTKKRFLEVTLGSGQTVKVEVGVSQPEAESRGTLLFIPGFQASADEFDTLLGTFRSRGWTVSTLALPGQGPSGGTKDDIADFADYGAAVQAWLTWVSTQGWSGPKVLVAHSLGAAAAFEALRRPGALVPDRVVFCAPLLRTTWYAPLTLAARLPGFPYGHWLGSLDRWLTRLEGQGPVDLPLTIYTGTADTVVDADGNRGTWQRLVPTARLVSLPGRDHWFLQRPGAREEFLVTLAELLGW